MPKLLNKTPLSYELLVELFAVLLVVGCFAIPEKLVIAYQISVPSFSNRLPLVSVFFPLAIFLVIANRSELFKMLELKTVQYALALSVVPVWFLIETKFSLNYKYNWSYIIPQFWFFLFFWVFSELDLATKNNLLRGACLGSVLLVCCIQILRYLEIVPGALTPFAHIIRGDRPDGLDLNFSSYVAVFGIWIILFTTAYKDNKRVSPSFFSGATIGTILLFMMLVNRTYGALLIATALILIRYCVFKKLPFIILVFILAILTFSLLWLVSMNEGIFSLIESIRSDSIRQRMGSLYITIMSGLENPFFGIGAKESLNVRYEGMLAHTYYARVFLAYGIIGLLSWLLALFFMFSSCVRDKILGAYVGLSGIFLLIGVMTFETHLYWWYATIPALCNSEIRQNFLVGGKVYGS